MPGRNQPNQLRLVGFQLIKNITRQAVARCFIGEIAVVYVKGYTSPVKPPLRMFSKTERPTEPSRSLAPTTATLRGVSILSRLKMPMPIPFAPS